MIINSALDKSNMVQRYMIVEHPMHKRAICFDEKGAFKNILPLHPFLGQYHWKHLDTNHVIVIGMFHPHHHAAIVSRDDTSMLPSLHASKKVCASVKKPAHWEALKKAVPVDESHNMADVAECLAARYGSVFMPTR